MKKYDVFISYRREGGYETAKHLNDLLVRDGYRVSFDIDTLRSGDFDTQLFNRIEHCKDFILIVDEHAFDRTLDKDFDPKNDWLRCELAHAIKHQINIIPVFLAGVSGFPDNLPSDIAEVTRKNAPQYNKFYFNDFYRLLCSRFLTSRSPKRRLFIPAALLSVLLLIGSFFTVRYFVKEVVYIDPLAPKLTDEVQFRNYASDILASDIRSTVQYELFAFLSDSLRYAYPKEIQKDTSAIYCFLSDNALEGDGEALFRFGLCHIVGFGCEYNSSKAVAAFEKAADQGLSSAQYSLGVCYANGIGVKPDMKKAETFFRAAAEQGLPEAQSDYGLICKKANNQKYAYQYISSAVNSGYAPAQYNSVYLSDNLYSKASVDMLRKSADQGYEPAQIVLAYVYVNGPDNLKDLETAIPVLKELADRNNGIALCNLAICYETGSGVPEDIDLALDMLERSVENGYAPAIVYLASWYMDGLRLQQDYVKAMELYKKAAEQGYPPAQFYLGQMYENGWGVKPNRYKAKKLYRLAQAQGFDIAQAIEQQKYMLRSIL